MAKKISADPVSGHSFLKQYILIGVLSILVYANTLHHGFVLDDTAVIENNKFVKAGVKGIPDILSTFYWQGYWDSNAGLYRPLSLISFAIEYQISPANPLIHHLFNILYYALVCCLLYEFLRTLFKSIDHRFFLFAVLLFIVHPIHTEVVANIKSRDEIFCLLFFLLCCRQFYLLPIVKTKNVLLGSFFFLLALLSKEGAIIFLPIIFLIDYQKEKNILSLVKQRAPLLGVILFWFAWHQYIIYSSASPRITYTYSDNSLLMSSSFIQQKATAFGMFARYIIKAFYPYQLSYDYSFNQIPIISFGSVPAIGGLLILIALIYIACKNFKSNWILTFSIAMIVLPLLLTGNLFFTIGATMADRFLFISTIGSCIIICWLIYKLFKTDLASTSQPIAMRTVFVVILVLFSARTFTRNKDWKDNATLFRNDVLVSPNSARTHYNNAFALQTLVEKGDLSASEKEYEWCLSIDPDYRDALINLGVVYTRQKKFTEAIKVYQRALSVNKKDPELLGNIGDTYYKSGQIDSSIYYLEMANKAGNNSSGMYNVLGAALFAKKEYAEACVVFEKGLQKDTTNADLYLNYGNALAISAKYQEALKALLHAYRINNTNASTAYFIALTYSKLGDTLQANKYFNEYKQLK